MLAPYPGDRLHNQHPPPPVSQKRGQPNRAKTTGSILDADPPPRGPKLHAKTHAEYFNSPDNLSRVATARRYKACPTLKQVRAMIEALPAATETQQRDRALIAFALVSGARDRAIVSFKLKHIDIENELIEQDARDVRTKRAKTFTTWFFPVGEDIRQVFVDWVAFLREQKGFGAEDPLFPKSKVAPGGDDLEFRAVGLDRAQWANANPSSGNLSRSLLARWIAVFQSAFVAEYTRPIGLRIEARRGAVQGLVAESGSRELPDDVFELRRDSRRPAGRNHSRPRMRNRRGRRSNGSGAIAKVGGKVGATREGCLIRGIKRFV